MACPHAAGRWDRYHSAQELCERWLPKHQHVRRDQIILEFQARLLGKPWWVTVDAISGLLKAEYGRW